MARKPGLFDSDANSPFYTCSENQSNVQLPTILVAALEAIVEALNAKYPDEEHDKSSAVRLLIADKAGVTTWSSREHQAAKTEDTKAEAAKETEAEKKTRLDKMKTARAKVMASLKVSL